MENVLEYGVQELKEVEADEIEGGSIIGDVTHAVAWSVGVAARAAVYVVQAAGSAAGLHYVHL